MHCQWHWKREIKALQGNRKADRETKLAALREGETLASLTAALFP
jgi:hypothetical protein